MTEHLRVGTYVKLHPACDAWMMGFRYGRVTLIGRQYISVRASAIGTKYLVTGPKSVVVKKLLRFPLNTDLLEVINDQADLTDARSSGRAS
jgi:hypothetical protein